MKNSKKEIWILFDQAQIEKGIDAKINLVGNFDPPLRMTIPALDVITPDGNIAEDFYNITLSLVGQGDIKLIDKDIAKKWAKQVFGNAILINKTLNNSTANGPGERWVMWTQGCSMSPKCRGCFNRDTWTTDGGVLFPIDVLVEKVDELGDVGISITGGEPQDQLPQITEFCKKVYKKHTIILFTGRDSVDPELAKYIDLAVVGQFDITTKTESPLLGSSNQKILLFSTRIALADLQGLPRTEAKIDSNGIVTLTGFDVEPIYEGDE